MGAPVIETVDLTKKYDRFIAVDRLNLSVEEGEVFGLLGPNGAGKTTTILMLLGLTVPTYGSVRVLGFDPGRQPLSVKSRVGYMPDQVGFYDELSAWENLSYTARLNGIPYQEATQRIQEVLEWVGLTERAEQNVGAYSRGMRQRLGVADMLLKRPEIIIMDEPTQGLDPEGAREFLHLIQRLKSEGLTVLLSSHLLHQVQAVCDRVGLFRQGRMMLQGSVAELAQRVLGGAYRITVQALGDQAQIIDTLTRLPGSLKVQETSEGFYAVEAVSDLRSDAARAIIQAGGRLLKIDSELLSLDEIYSKYFREAPHA